MMDMGYPLHLIDLLAKLYRKQLAKVKVAGTLSEWFHVKKGVRQGCVLSPYLFNILAEAEVQELMDRLDRVSRKYSLLVNVGKTKIMASNGTACRILIQTEQLEQMNTFPYYGSLITEDGECTTEFRTRLNRGQAIGPSLQKIWKCHSIPISTKIRLMQALV